MTTCQHSSGTGEWHHLQSRGVGVGTGAVAACQTDLDRRLPSGCALSYLASRSVYREYGRWKTEEKGEGGRRKRRAKVEGGYVELEATAEGRLDLSIRMSGGLDE